MHEVFTGSDRFLSNIQLAIKNALRFLPLLKVLCVEYTNGASLMCN